MDTITTTAPGYARFDIGRLALFFSEGRVIAYGLKWAAGDDEWNEAGVTAAVLPTPGHRRRAGEELGLSLRQRSARQVFEADLTALLEQFDLLGEE